MRIFPSPTQHTLQLLSDQSLPEVKQNFRRGQESVEAGTRLTLSLLLLVMGVGATTAMGLEVGGAVFICCSWFSW